MREELIETSTNAKTKAVDPKRKVQVKIKRMDLLTHHINCKANNELLYV